MQAATAQTVLEPTMIAGRSGALFAVHHAPARRGSSALLYLPPFAEEANRSRKMATLQARAMAEAGVGALILDPYGTGDSGGDFRGARWETWCDDATCAIAWLHQHGYESIVLLGLRLGAMLALQVAAQRRDDVARVILWQPVLRGDQLMTQFLRLRLAAELSTGGGEGTAALRRELAERGSVEIAGYEVDRAMVDAIDALRLADLGLACAAPIDWVDVVAEAGQSVSPAQDAVLKRWKEAGKAISHRQAVGVPFWTLQETAAAPALVSLTTSMVVPS